jgi:putative ABC transport system permease protein
VGAVAYKASLDVRSRRLQSASILLLTALSAFLIGISTLTLLNADSPFDRLFVQLHGAHVWAFYPDSTTTSDVLAVLQANPATAEVSAPLAGIDTGLLRNGAKESVFVVGLPPEQQPMGRLLLLSGSYLAASTPTGVVIDHQLAERDGLHVGSTISVATPIGAQHLAVVGISLDVNHGAIDQEEPRVYVLDAQFASLFGAAPQQVRFIGIRIADPAQVHAYEADVRQAFGDQALTANVGTDWLYARDTYTQFIKLAVVLLLMFGIVATVASGLLIVSLITSSVLAQSRDIGILKTIGFTPGQIARLYLVEHVALAFVGAAVGLAASLAIAPFTLAQTARALNTTPVTTVNPPLLLATLAGITAVEALFSVLPAWRAGRISSVATITGTYRPARNRVSWLGGLARLAHLPESWAIGVGLAFARRWRAMLTELSLITAVVTAIITAGLFATIAPYSTPASEGIYSSALVIPSLYGVDATRRLLASQPDVASYYSYIRQSSLAVYGVDKNSETNLQIEYLTGDVAPIRASLQAGRWYEDAATEAVLPVGLLNTLHEQLGDDLLVLNPLPVHLRIVGTYAAAYTGAPLLASDAIRPPTTGGATSPTPTFAVTLKPQVDVAAWSRAMLAASDGRVVVAIQDPNPPAQVQLLKNAMLLPAAILAIVAVVSVLNAMYLMTRERYYDLGVLKVIGMTPRDILSIVQSSSALYAVIAVLVGIPLGVVVTSWLFQTIADAQGFGVVQTSVNIVWVLLVIPAAILVTLAGSLLPGRSAAESSAVAVLHGQLQ